MQLGAMTRSSTVVGQLPTRGLREHRRTLHRLRSSFAHSPVQVGNREFVRQQDRYTMLSGASECMLLAWHHPLGQTGDAQPVQSSGEGGATVPTYFVRVYSIMRSISMARLSVPGKGMLNELSCVPSIQCDKKLRPC